MRKFRHDVWLSLLACWFGPLGAAAAGQLLPPAEYQVAGSPSAVAIGDVAGDDSPDLVTANGVGHSVSILVGHGNGTYMPEHEIVLPFTPIDVAIGDLDNDGMNDLVLARVHGVSVMFGSGTLVLETGSYSPMGALPQSLLLIDVDNDGNLDAVTENSDTNQVAVFLGSGTGGFEMPALPYAMGGSPTSLVAGDVDQDGNVDFAASNPHVATVSLLRGVGDGSFGPFVSFDVGQWPGPVALGDLDHDGQLDLAVGNEFSHTISILIGSGAATFTPLPAAPVSNGPSDLAIGDFDADGHPDLAATIAMPFIAILKGAGDGSFGAQALTALGGIPKTMESADLDANGIPDIVTTHTQSVLVCLAQDPGCSAIVASAQVVRLGTPPNPLALLPTTTTAPILGQVWKPRIDHTTFQPGAFFDGLFISALPANVPTPGMGTLLCELTPSFVFLTASAGAEFTLPMPQDCALAGLSFCCQGVSMSFAGKFLTNALDVTIGTY